MILQYIFKIKSWSYDSDGPYFLFAENPKFNSWYLQFKLILGTKMQSTNMNDKSTRNF